MRDLNLLTHPYFITCDAYGSRFSGVKIYPLQPLVNCEYILSPWIWGISSAWLSASLAVAHSRDFALKSYLKHRTYILLWHSWKQIPLANFQTVQMIPTRPTFNDCCVVFQWLQTNCTELAVSLSVKILATHPIQTKSLGTLYSQTILPSYFLNPMKTWLNVR